MRRVDGNQSPRFLLHAAWEVERPDGSGILGRPWPFRALLVLDNLFEAVLPYEFRTSQRIHVHKSAGSAHPWNGIPCDLGICTFWLFSEDAQTTLALRLQVRLPQCRASPEPQYPLIGTEFLKRYHPRLSLWYDRFRFGLSASLTDAVGRMTLA
jgi:hypothetical protein